MGRKKIAIELRKDKSKRKNTLEKRTKGLMKKAAELAILTNCKIALTIVIDDCCVDASLPAVKEEGGASDGGSQQEGKRHTASPAAAGSGSGSSNRIVWRDTIEFYSDDYEDVYDAYVKKPANASNVIIGKERMYEACGKKGAAAAPSATAAETPGNACGGSKNQKKPIKTEDVAPPVAAPDENGSSAKKATVRVKKEESASRGKKRKSPCASPVAAPVVIKQEQISPVPSPVPAIEDLLDVPVLKKPKLEQEEQPVATAAALAAPSQSSLQDDIEEVLNMEDDPLLLDWINTFGTSAPAPAPAVCTVQSRAMDAAALEQAVRDKCGREDAIRGMHAFAFEYCVAVR
jgi:hypothetical protein